MTQKLLPAINSIVQMPCQAYQWIIQSLFQRALLLIIARNACCELEHLIDKAVLMYAFTVVMPIQVTVTVKLNLWAANCMKQW